MTIHTQLLYDCFDLFFRGATAPTGFFVALVTRKNPDTLDAADATNEGGGLVGIPVTGHVYSAGQLIRIDGTEHYDGEWFISATTANKVLIAASYTAEIFSGSETIYQAPDPDNDTMADLVEIPAGNGYTSGGIAIARNSTDFDSLAIDADNNRVDLQLKDIAFTASGGTLPSSGNAFYAVLTGLGATVANRKIYASCWLNSANGVSANTGNSIAIVNMTIRAASGS